MNDETKQDEPITFTESECDRIARVANWYACLCRSEGRAAPPDAFRAVLEAAEYMAAYISAREAMEEQALNPETIQ